MIEKTQIFKLANQRAKLAFNETLKQVSQAKRFTKLNSNKMAAQNRKFIGVKEQFSLDAESKCFIQIVRFTNTKQQTLT